MFRANKLKFSPEIERIIIAEIQFIAERVEASLIRAISSFCECFTSPAFLPFAVFIYFFRHYANNTFPGLIVIKTPRRLYVVFAKLTY